MNKREQEHKAIQEQRLINANEHLLNVRDNGGQGKGFELITKYVLNSYSKATQVMQRGKHDLIIYLNGTRCNVEIKTGLKSEIAFNTDLYKSVSGVADYSIWDLYEGQKSDYIIYSYDSTIENARFMSKGEFFKYLSDYQYMGSKCRDNTLVKKIKATTRNKLEGRFGLNCSNEKSQNYMKNITSIGIALTDLMKLRQAQ